MEVFNNLEEKYHDMKIVDALVPSASVPPLMNFFMYKDK